MLVCYCSQTKWGQIFVNTPNSESSMELLQWSRLSGHRIITVEHIPRTIHLVLYFLSCLMYSFRSFFIIFFLKKELCWNRTELKNQLILIMHFFPKKKVFEGSDYNAFPKKIFQKVRQQNFFLKKVLKNTKLLLKLQIHVISKISKNFIDK